MKSMQFLISSLLILFSLNMAVGQTTLSGKVVDNEGEPVILGNVALYLDGELLRGVETDFDGLYSFGYVEPGIYDVEFSYVGFPTLRVTDVVIVENQNNVLDAALEQRLSNINVIGGCHYYDKPLIDLSDPTSGSIYTSDEIRNSPNKSR